MTKAGPLVASMLPSHLATLMIMCTHPPFLLTIVPTNHLTINLVLVSDMMPVFYRLGTNVVSAKTPTQSNGLNAKCTIPPLVLKLRRIFMSCANLHILQNLVQHLLWLHVIPTCHHTTIVTLTPLIMRTTVAAPQNATAPIAALAVVLAAMTFMMMINVVIGPLVLVLTTISLLTKVHQAACLKIQHHIPMALIIWNGIPTHQPTLTIPFILMVMPIMKTLSPLLIA